MRYQKKDICVGIFVVVAIAVLGGVILIKRGSDIGYYSIIAEFENISSVSKGTKIKLRGFEVGKVRRVEFYPEGLRPGVYVEVELGIRERYPLFIGTKARIKSAGFVGETFLDLDVSEAAAVRLEDGDVIPGLGAYDTGILTRKAEVLLDKMALLADDLRDADLGGKLRKFVEKTGEISRGVRRLADRGGIFFEGLSATLDTLRPEMQSVLSTLDEDLKETGALTEDLRSVLADNRDPIAQSLASLEESLRRLDHILANVDSLTTDNYQELDTALKNMEAASASLRDLAQHPWKVMFGGVEEKRD